MNALVSFPRSTPMGKRATWLVSLITSTLFLVVLLYAPSPRAETRREYVNRYVLLTDWITRSEQWIMNHMEDPGVCRMAHTIAEQHVELARRMTPPPEFSSIHPHMLLVLENAERMFDRASAGDRVGFRRHRRIVHEERRIITEILQAEGQFMPAIGP